MYEFFYYLIPILIGVSLLSGVILLFLYFKRKRSIDNLGDEKYQLDVKKLLERGLVFLLAIPFCLFVFYIVYIYFLWIFFM